MDINAQDPGLGTALMSALGHEARPKDQRHPHIREMIKYLLEKGADPNLGGGKIGKPLHCACYNNAPICVVRSLLDRGAEINGKAGIYGYPLQAACAGYASIEIIHLLLSRGAHVNAKGGICWTAIQAATYRGNLRVVKLLLKYGARFDLESETHGPCDSIDIIGPSASRWERSTDLFRSEWKAPSQYHVLNFLADFDAA